MTKSVILIKIHLNLLNLMTNHQFWPMELYDKQEVTDFNLTQKN